MDPDKQALVLLITLIVSIIMGGVIIGLLPNLWYVGFMIIGSSIVLFMLFYFWGKPDDDIHRVTPP